MTKFKIQKEKIALIIIFLFALAVRLYKIDSPVADWHSWRQADTAAVARNFEKFGFDPLRPRYDDLSNVQSGKDNPQGYRMVEFPVYQSLGFGLYQILKFIPGMTMEIALRLISILSSLGIMAILYEITKKNLLSLIIFGFLPYSVFYSRVILPEMLAVFWAMAAIWMYDRSKIISGILAGLAILTKPTAGFLLLPLAYFWIRDFKFNTTYLLRFLIFLFFSFAGFLFWRKWILQFPEGIPASEWLLNAGNIRFSGAYFYWLLGERLSKLILGYWLLIPLGIGLVMKNYTIYILAIGVALYAAVFARGNVQHDYYQILWLPIIAIFTGQGGLFLLTKQQNINRVLSGALALICLGMGILLSWHEIRGYYWINNQAIVEAGQALDKIVDKNAKVIAPYSGDTAFLYQTKRQGWPVGFEIENKITMGADYYVNINVNDAETQYVLKKWMPVAVNDRYVIVKLK